jgi:uncharacterized protein RhaS with RHS repeats
LLGGINAYRYGANPVAWIDLKGLTAEKERRNRQRDAIGSVADGKSNVLPENYDFLADKYINRINKAQIDHNKAIDIENLINAESSNFFMRDMNFVENTR